MAERKDRLEESIRRIRDAIDAPPQGDQAIARPAIDRIAAVVDEQRERKIARRQEREERRLERGQGRYRRPASSPEAFVYGLAAVVLFGFALANSHLWWLIFIALGLATKAARVLSAARNVQQTTPESTAEGTRVEHQAVPKKIEAIAPKRELFPEVEARTARVDAICDKLFSEVRSGPALVREIIDRPEEMFKAFRDSCHEIARREIGLRSTIRAEDGERLKKERETLVARLEHEKDAVARDSLGKALTALDSQIAQRAYLVTLASRFEAEATRILYTLENLYAQVLSAKSSDASSADHAGAGLRRSLVQVTEEMAAVAEALETVNRDDRLARGNQKAAPSPVADISSSGDGGSTPTIDRIRG